jgi:hypothetical protein
LIDPRFEIFTDAALVFRESLQESIVTKSEGGHYYGWYYDDWYYWRWYCLWR